MTLLQVKDMDSHTPGIGQSLRHAKLLLKKSKRVDYYKLLEISQDANDYDIKKVAPLLSTLCCAAYTVCLVPALLVSGTADTAAIVPQLTNNFVPAPRKSILNDQLGQAACKPRHLH